MLPCSSPCRCTLTLLTKFHCAVHVKGIGLAAFLNHLPPRNMRPLIRHKSATKNRSHTIIVGEKTSSFACSASTHNSYEDGATTPVESEINDAQIIGMLASPLFIHEREASADQPRIYHSRRENSGQSSSSFRSNIGNPMTWFSHWSTGKPVALFLQERERESSSEVGTDEEG